MSVKKDHFTIRKTLYIASEKVVDLEIGKRLTMISNLHAQLHVPYESLLGM